HVTICCSFFHATATRRHLHSFPTRRSSDLKLHLPAGGKIVREEQPLHLVIRSHRRLMRRATFCVKPARCRARLAGNHLQAPPPWKPASPVEPCRQRQNRPLPCRIHGSSTARIGHQGPQRRHG